MARRPRLGKKLVKSLLPILLLVLLTLGGIMGWIVYNVSQPHRGAYLVTPQAFAQISGPGVKASEETWRNRDGTIARGWLLRGAEGAPAVVLLHRYGTDRSWLFNLGVKLNETTSFTILWPDLRGHGLKPPVKTTSFGVNEGDDLLAALDHLQTLKGQNGRLVGEQMGAYGNELGAYIAIKAATQDPRLRVLVLDSIPHSPDELVNAAVKGETGISYRPFQYLARLAMRAYFVGRYDNTSSCSLAASLPNQQVLLLSGTDAGYLRESTASLVRCFPDAAKVQAKTDLPLTGFSLSSATGEQGEGYDRQVIEFFDRNLRSRPAIAPTTPIGQ